MSAATSDLRRFIACPCCGARLSVSAAHPAGTRIRCGACDQLFRAPGPAVVGDLRRATDRPTIDQELPSGQTGPFVRPDSVPDKRALGRRNDDA
ncbi:MAG: hypothetical protein U1F43_35615 [Myxococcota bacterium]